MEKKCEDCKIKACRYGISANKGKPGGQLRWCSSCAKAHAEAELLHRGLQCEDCGQVSANYRMPDDSRERWCAGCARKSHPEALVFEAQRKAKKWAAAYKCETCKAVAPSHGLRMEGKARWCEGCAAAHNGAVHLGRCETCPTRADYGLLAEGKKRWCSKCAPGHPSAVRLARERIKGCEDCNERGCKYGLPAEGMLRWCSVCAHKSHPLSLPKTQNGKRVALWDELTRLRAEGWNATLNRIKELTEELEEQKTGKKPRKRRRTMEELAAIGHKFVTKSTRKCPTCSKSIHVLSRHCGQCGAQVEPLKQSRSELHDPANVNAANVRQDLPVGVPPRRVGAGSRSRSVATSRGN